MRTIKKAEKKVAFGFFFDIENETIFFSKTFMKGAKQMGSGESVLYMNIVSDYPNFKRVTI